MLSPDDPPLSAIRDGAYDLIDPNTIIRNAGATIFLPSENEWYKAAYYDPSSPGYFLFPTSSNSEPNCMGPTGVPNSANCDDGQPSTIGDLEPVGSYPGSPSPYGTFDQGGNASEWTETEYDEFQRAVRGGSFDLGYGYMVSEFRDRAPDHIEVHSIGFRLAAPIPEPQTGLLLTLGLIGLAGRRRQGSSS